MVEQEVISINVQHHIAMLVHLAQLSCFPDPERSEQSPTSQDYGTAHEGIFITY